MNRYGSISKVLQKIKEAKTPERFSQDFLSSTLGFTSGTDKPIIPLLKRIGFLLTDGSPTEIYKSFRNPDTSKTAMGKAIREGYSQLFDINENAHKLDKNALEGIIIQVTGLDQGSSTLKSISGSFNALKAFATFEQQRTQPSVNEEKPPQRDFEEGTDEPVLPFKLGLSYTINLNLPKTEDIAVYNAIFRSLRDNLLQPNG